jgi:hypothetical protein
VKATMHSEVLMGLKKRIAWSGLVLALLLVGALFTGQEWVGCTHAAPDEYMDLELVTGEHEELRVFQSTPLVNSSLFAWRPEFRSSKTFPTPFAGNSPCLEPHFKVILRI